MWGDQHPLNLSPPMYPYIVENILSRSSVDEATTFKKTLKIK